MRKIGFRLCWAVMIMVLSVGMISAHGEAEPVTVRFAAMVGELPAACGITYTGLGTEASQVSLNDFRFYVSNLRLIDAEGKETVVELTQDGLWQYENVALLDFEDGTAGCGEAGNPEMNNRVIGEVHEGDYTGIAFDLGIPFELNHLDTTTAPAPLNIPAMWWNWQFGYKFVRVDMLTPTSEIPSWFIHLGSTGCEAANGTSAPEEPCSNSNVVSVRLDTFNPSTNFVIADLSQLLADVNLTENTPEPPGCMSMSEDPDCGGLFAGFGLDLATGTTLEGNLQNFFHVKGETFDIVEAPASEGGMNMDGGHTPSGDNTSDQGHSSSEGTMDHGHSSSADVSLEGLSDPEIIDVLSKGYFETPENPLTVAPIVILGDYAVAGWTQGTNGGRAFWHKVDGTWSAVICSGISLKEAATYVELGMTEEDATALAEAVATAEAELPAETVAQLDSFEGTVDLQGTGLAGHS